MTSEGCRLALIQSDCLACLNNLQTSFFLSIGIKSWAHAQFGVSLGPLPVKGRFQMEICRVAMLCTGKQIFSISGSGLAVDQGCIEVTELAEGFTAMFSA